MVLLYPMIGREERQSYLTPQRRIWHMTTPPGRIRKGSSICDRTADRTAVRPHRISGLGSCYY